MQEAVQLGGLVVYKNGALNDKQGFLAPLFSLSEENQYESISRDDYPADVLVSRGYPDVDKAYRDGELFMLRSHYKDEQKTQQHGAPRYWAKGDAVCSLPANTLLPVFEHTLPPKETGALPEGVSPPRGTFFLLDEHKVYGPLTSTLLEDGHHALEPMTHPSLSLGKDYLGVFDADEITDCLMSVDANGNEYLYITSIKDLSKHKSDRLDYMSDDRLIKFFNQKGVGPSLKALARKDAERLQQAISKFERVHQSAKSERFDRLKVLVSRYLNEADIGYELVRDYLSSNSGSRFLDDYVARHQSSLLSGHLEKVKANARAEEESIKRQLADLDKQIDLRVEELERIQKKVSDKREESKAEIERIHAETQEQARLKLEAQQEELSRVVAEEEEKLSEIQTSIDTSTKRLGLINNLDKLREEQIYYERSNDKLKAAAKGFEDALKSPQELAAKMGEMEVISRVLNGGTAAVANTQAHYLPVDFASVVPNSREELIEQVCSHFEDDGGRQFSKEEMTNLLVSISQSFLTVLAGAPGVGKTSSVVRLAQSLHLGETCGSKNFLYVPVGRGWVSGRDILGFYNSLKGVFQRSRTGLYDFLRRSDEVKKNALQLVLLDEANLSSMEHYWSDFLGMCDHEGRSRPLDTGIPNSDERFLKIGDHVRFVATINNDSTTERLSPRLIDRVPVISLEQHGSDVSTSSSGSLKLDGALEAKLFHELFAVEDAELSRADEALLAEVVGILMDRDADLGQTVPISHRKKIAITNYCAVAGEIIGSSAAMDFAISQHVLPHIEGYGTKFRNRITQLQSVLSKSHPRSSQHIERILAGGNDFSGTYSFF